MPTAPLFTDMLAAYSSYFSQLTRFYDASGNKRHATANSDVTYSPIAGHFKRSAFVLDAGDKYGTIPTSELNHGSNFSFSCWISPTTVSQSTIISTDTVGAVYSIGYFFTGMGDAFIRVQLNGDFIISYARAPITDNTHITVTSEEGVGTKLYVDGILAASSAIAIPPIISGYTYRLFHTMTEIPTNVFLGTAADLIFWNKTLSEDEAEWLADPMNNILVRRLTVRVKTDNPGTSNNDQYTLIGNPTIMDYDFHIDWGDGVEEDISGTGQDWIHTYPEVGVYDIKISDNTYTGLRDIRFGNNVKDRQKLIEVIDWGTDSFNTLNNLFYGCVNLIKIDNNFPIPCRNAVSATNGLRGIGITGNNYPEFDFDDTLNTLFTFASTFRDTRLTDFKFTFPKNATSSVVHQIFNNNPNLVNLELDLNHRPINTIEPIAAPNPNLRNVIIKNYSSGLFLGPTQPVNSSAFGAAFSTNSYDNLLNELVKGTQNNATCRIATAKYSKNGKAARDALIARGWTFIDDGYTNLPQGLGELAWYCPTIKDGPEDLSGNDYHGTYQGGMGTVVDTERGGKLAYSHNVLSTLNQYIICGYVPYGNTLSVSAWVKPIDSPADSGRGIVGHWQVGGNQRGYFLGYDAQNNQRNTFSISSNGVQSRTCTQLTDTTPDWVHLVGINNSQGTYLFVDGALARFVSGEISIFQSSSPLWIGRIGQQSIFWRGWIDDVRIYTRSLVQEEITQLASRRGYRISEGLLLRRRKHIVRNPD